jgi:hypothetical protein
MGRIILPDYREVLRNELEKRKCLTPKYSMRDFAKDLGLFPSHLCYLLKNRKGLSKKSASRISGVLEYKNLLRRQFIFMVSAKSGRSKFERRLAKVALERPPFSSLGLNAIRNILLENKKWKAQIEIVFAVRDRHFQRDKMDRFESRVRGCGII